MTVVLEQQRQRRTGVDRTPREAKQVRQDLGLVEDRVAPVVEADQLGKQLRAQPVRLTGDRVDAKPEGSSKPSPGDGWAAERQPCRHRIAPPATMLLDLVLQHPRRALDEPHRSIRGDVRRPSATRSASGSRAAAPDPACDSAVPKAPATRGRRKRQRAVRHRHGHLIRGRGVHAGRDGRADRAADGARPSLSRTRRASVSTRRAGQTRRRVPADWLRARLLVGCRVVAARSGDRRRLPTRRARTVGVRRRNEPKRAGSNRPPA